MAAYTDATSIASYLGVTFTPEQAAAADQAAAAATTFVDHYTGRTWQTSTPVLGEARPIVVPSPSDRYGSVARCYLAHTPATTIATVSLRGAGPNAPLSLLDSAAYELVDAPNGVLLLPGYGYGTWAGWSSVPGMSGSPGALAIVDYAYTDTPPPDVALATTMIASGVMQQQLTIAAGSSAVAANPALAGVEQIAVGQNDISVKLSSTFTQGAGQSSAEGSAWAAPGSAVAAILDGYRRPVIA